MIKLERFWVADDQTRAILDCRRSNSRDFGLQRVKLKRFWIAEGQTQAILGCRGSTSNDFGLQRVKLTRFGVAEGQTQGTNTGMLEDQTIRFILLAGRSLLLDLLMLEALLVVDELPQSSVFHINAEMVETQSTGSVNAPAWATRPASIDEGEWVRLQGSLFPERISISLCDCDLDLLDVTFLASNGFDTGDLAGQWNLKNAEGLTPYGPHLMWLGLILGIVATSFEVRRFTRAQRLAESFARQSKKWD